MWTSAGPLCLTWTLLLFLVQPGGCGGRKNRQVSGSPEGPQSTHLCLHLPSPAHASPLHARHRSLEHDSDTPRTLATQHEGQAGKCSERTAGTSHKENADGFPDHADPACRKHWGALGILRKQHVSVLPTGPHTCVKTHKVRDGSPQSRDYLELGTRMEETGVKEMQCFQFLHWICAFLIQLEHSSTKVDRAQPRQRLWSCSARAPSLEPLKGPGQ